jgi:hypothetical protein
MTKTQNHSSDSPEELNDKDANLTAFLRQYAPPVPVSARDAEDRLMMAIASSTKGGTHPASAKGSATDQTIRKNRSLKRQIAIVAGCSALVYGLWQLSQVIMPPNHSAGELAEIENFWFQNWDGVANAEETYPWLTKGDSGVDLTARRSTLTPTATHFDRSHLIDISHPRQE